MDQYASNRAMMKSDWSPSVIGQAGRLLAHPRPAIVRAADPTATVIPLPPVTADVIRKSDVFACLRDRRSQRRFSQDDLTLAELSFLLWATQGVDKVVEDKATMRRVPSGSARHPFETELAILHVAGIQQGLYHYLPLTHSLEAIATPPDFSAQLLAAMDSEAWAVESAAIFFWSCIPERGEWAWGAAAHKMALLDAGHISQNLYLACEAIGCGTCAVAGYSQTATDSLLGLSGDDEFVTYVGPVGRLR